MPIPDLLPVFIEVSSNATLPLEVNKVTSVATFPLAVIEVTSGVTSVHPEAQEMAYPVTNACRLLANMLPYLVLAACPPVSAMSHHNSRDNSEMT